MPTYDYKCLECGHIEEYFFTLKEKEESDNSIAELICPECDFCGMYQFYGNAPRIDYFPEFTVKHLANKNGGVAPTFKSMSEIKAFEKKHNVRWELGGYDKPQNVEGNY